MGGGEHKSRGDRTSAKRANTCTRKTLIISVNTVPHHTTRSLLMNSHQSKGTTTTSFGPAAGGAPVNYKTWGIQRCVEKTFLPTQMCSEYPRETEEDGPGQGRDARQSDMCMRPSAGVRRLNRRYVRAIATVLCSSNSLSDRGTTARPARVVGMADRTGRIAYERASRHIVGNSW
eukprot:1185171-Prorocentrum_minimum.AAC.2